MRLTRSRKSLLTTALPSALIFGLWYRGCSQDSDSTLPLSFVPSRTGVKPPARVRLANEHSSPAPLCDQSYMPFVG
jgi:hypothetical protein